MTWIARNPTNF